MPDNREKKLREVFGDTFKIIERNKADIYASWEANMAEGAEIVTVRNLAARLGAKKVVVAATITTTKAAFEFMIHY